MSQTQQLLALVVFAISLVVFLQVLAYWLSKAIARAEKQPNVSKQFPLGIRLTYFGEAVWYQFIEVWYREPWPRIGVFCLAIAMLELVVYLGSYFKLIAL